MCNVGMAANDTLTPTPDAVALTGPDGSFSLTAPVEGTYTRSNEHRRLRRDTRDRCH